MTMSAGWPSLIRRWPNSSPPAGPVGVASFLGKRGVFKRHLGQRDADEDLHAALALVPAGTDDATPDWLATRAQDPPWPRRPFRGHRRGPARAWAEEALDLARRSGAVGTEVNARLTLAISATAPTFQSAPGSEALALIGQARVLATRSSQFQLVARAATWSPTCWRRPVSMSARPRSHGRACARRRPTA